MSLTRIAGLVVTSALALAVSVAAQGPAAAPQPAAPAGNADAGKTLFVNYGCYQCHGYEAQGGAAGPRLASRSLAYAAFARYVRRPTNQMPPYTEKVVTDADLANILAYVQSRPAPPQHVPLLAK